MCCVPVRYSFSFFLNTHIYKKQLYLNLDKTILDRVHKAVNEKINQSNFIQRHLFHLSYQMKVKRLELGLESPNLDK